MEKLEIIIWDNDVKRIREIDANLFVAAKRCGCSVVTKSISEPPLLAREGLLPRVPVLEIAGQYWSLKPQTIFTEEQCVALVSKILGSTK